MKVFGKILKLSLFLAIIQYFCAQWFEETDLAYWVFIGQGVLLVLYIFFFILFLIALSGSNKRRKRKR